MNGKLQKHLQVLKKYVGNKERASRVGLDATGVEKYQLEQDIIARKKSAEAIVEKYLKEQGIIAKERAVAEAEAEEIAQREARIAESLIELGDEDDTELSAVARYVKKQEVLTQEKPAVSGVTKYMANKLIEASKKPPRSSVDKYLASQPYTKKIRRGR